MDQSTLNVQTKRVATLGLFVNKPTDEQIALHMRSRLDKHGNHGKALRETCDWYAAEVAPQWRPIDTAPVNERVLVNYGHISQDALLTPDENWTRIESGICRLIGYEPTHWMPLPEAPKDE